VAAGYDIHSLDLDRNGVACELELQDVARIDTVIDAAPSPQPTPSPITDSMQIDAIAPVAVANAVTASVVASQPAASGVMTTGVTTTAVAVNPVTTNTVGTAGAATTTTTSLAVAAAPLDSANAVAPIATDEGAAPTALSTVDMVRVLLFSPLGYLAIGVLVVVGALSLWVAYMLGQRGQAQGGSQMQAGQPKTVAPPHVPDEFALPPGNESPPRKG
jgi:hypothetical protein